MSRVGYVVNVAPSAPVPMYIAGRRLDHMAHSPRIVDAIVWPRRAQAQRNAPEGAAVERVSL